MAPGMLEACSRSPGQLVGEGPHRSSAGYINLDSNTGIGLLIEWHHVTFFVAPAGCID